MLYINHEAEQYFRALENNKEALHMSYRHICDTLNQALVTQDYDKLFSLITYIESEEGYLAFEHIGETRRILRILHIIALEHKYLNTYFSSNCFSMNELMDKYFLTLFAFRRLLFKLSDFSVQEAKQYLQSNIISHFAAYILASEELLTPTDIFYADLMDIYTDYWPQSSMQQFLLMIQK